MAQPTVTGLHGSPISQLISLRHAVAPRAELSRACGRTQFCSNRRRHQRRGGMRTAAAVTNGAGPQKEKPLWLQQMEEGAEDDPDISAILDGANGDPDIVQARMEASMEAKHEAIMSEKTGSQEQMQVHFREVDSFDCWIWMELHVQPSGEEQDIIEEVLRSWFMIGRLGGYNGMNLQVFQGPSEDGASYMKYDTDECESALDAMFHDMSTTERNGNWMRTWVNMGTADELAFDVLINTLSNLSLENVGIKQLVIGGQNEDWPVPEDQYPKTSMDPMSTQMPWTDEGDDDDF